MWRVPRFTSGQRQRQLHDLGNQSKGRRQGGFADDSRMSIQFHHVFGTNFGILTEGEKFIPSKLRFLQASKFSSESKRLFGLGMDSPGAFWPMAFAVVLTKVA